MKTTCTCYHWNTWGVAAWLSKTQVSLLQQMVLFLRRHHFSVESVKELFVVALTLRHTLTHTHLLCWWSKNIIGCQRLWRHSKTSKQPPCNIQVCWWNNILFNTEMFQALHSQLTNELQWQYRTPGIGAILESELVHDLVLHTSNGATFHLHITKLATL